MLSNKTKGCLELIATNQLQMTKNVKVQKKIFCGFEKNYV